MVTIPRLRMEELADALLVARADPRERGPELDRLRARFYGHAQGAAWTVALRSRVWHRRDAADWTPAAPPAEVALEDPTHAELEALAARLGERTLAVEPAAWDARARQLADGLERGAHPRAVLEALHGRFRATDAAGALWTLSLTDRTWHRLEGATWVPAPPPERLTMSRALAAELELLLGPLEPAPFCARCGAPHRADARACTGCGEPRRYG